MPRKARKYLIGKAYHIMVQGLNKEYIFKDDKVKEIYRKILKNNSKEEEIKIIAYCIMDNHAHILAYSEEFDGISKVMQKTNTKYAINYNKINERVGFVFRNRFNIQEIRDEKHLKDCIVYIHKNPVKAGIVKNEKEYKYSSFNEYITKSDLISYDIIKEILGVNNKEELERATYLMHNKNIMEVWNEVENKVDYNKVINDARKDNLTDTQIITLLKERYNVSERIIAENMNMTRYKIRKILK